MSASQTIQQKLALAIIDFLRTSATDGSVAIDDAESIEIATSCIADAFKVDASDEDAMKVALGGQSLASIYGVFAKMKVDKAKVELTPEQKAEADAFKSKGNAAMVECDYESAISFYSQAINIVSDNAIYLSNRAAAYSAISKHKEAAEDAQKATKLNPKYAKAWSRLGLALLALNDTEGSMKAYEAGMKAEGNGGSDAMKNGFRAAQKKSEEVSLSKSQPSDISETEDASGAGGMPDLSSLAGMFGGGGGAGGAGGMPDLSSMMKNPMLQQMAQGLLKNPSMMNNLLNNPRLKDMANSLGGSGGAGGTPDFASLMNDPSMAGMAEMAKNLMGGAGAGAGGKNPPSA